MHFSAITKYIAATADHLVCIEYRVVHSTDSHSYSVTGLALRYIEGGSFLVCVGSINFIRH